MGRVQNLLSPPSLSCLEELNQLNEEGQKFKETHGDADKLKTNEQRNPAKQNEMERN
jgi:hypothetical protein